MENKQKVPKKGIKESESKSEKLGLTHAQNVAAYEAQLATVQGAIETLMSLMSVADINNVHLCTEVRRAHYAIARAGGQQQGT